MYELAGDAHLSFEGHLHGYRFPADWGASGEETEFLKRGTTSPRLDFVVLPLTREAVSLVLGLVVQGVKPSISHQIIHVQIERGGVLELGAYDNFHRECVVTGPGVGTGVLEQLKAEGVLRGFKAAASRQ